MNDNLPNNYDSWRLDNPSYYDEPDIYETSLDTFYHNDENLLSEFEEKVKELAKEYGLFENIEDVIEKIKE
jgi:hypothetical protein